MINSINKYSFMNQSNTASGKIDNNQSVDTFKQLLKTKSAEYESLDINKTTKLIDTGNDISIKESGLSEIAAANKNSELNCESSINFDIEKDTENLLERMTLYGKQLKNPDVSLKDINTLLQDIRQSSENLFQKLQSTDNADNDLVNIACECALTAQTECIKFERGDYI